MDNIYYRHKETKATVSMEYLKELNKNGNWIAFHNDLYYSQLNDEMSEPKLFTYRVSEIPFSDEFELVTLPDNEELEFLYEVRDYLIGKLSSNDSLGTDLICEIQQRIYKLNELVR